MVTRAHARRALIKSLSYSVIHASFSEIWLLEPIHGFVIFGNASHGFDAARRKPNSRDFEMRVIVTASD